MYGGGGGGIGQWLCPTIQYQVPFSWPCSIIWFFKQNQLTVEVQVVLTEDFAHKTQSLVAGKILQWLAAAEAVIVAAAKTETAAAAEAEKRA